MKRILSYAAVIVVYIALVGCVALLHGAKLGEVYKYDMHGDVSLKSAEEFRKFIEGKGLGDVVLLHLESEGGSILSMHKIIHYMSKTKAKIHCTVDSHAASAAANIFMKCDTLYAADHSIILFHVGRECRVTCVIATMSNNRELWEESRRFLLPIKPYLTEMEWYRMLNGKDIVLRGNEFMKRLRRGR